MNVKAIRGLACASVFSVTLGLIAGYQVLGESRDYENYLAFFEWLRGSKVGSIFQSRIEPGFSLLSFALANCQLSNVAIYSTIAGASVFIKYLALKSTRNYWPVVAIFTFFYLARYAALFEMTVLRATVALSIAFYVFYRRNEHEYRAGQIVLLLLSVTMHYSAIMLIPMYLIRPVRRASVLVAGLMFFAVIVASKELALAILPDYLEVFSMYREFNKATLVPIPFGLDVAFLIIILINWKKNDHLMRTCALGMAVGVAFHFSLVEYSLFASRFRELFSVFVLLYVVRAVGYAPNSLKYATVVYAVASATMHAYVVFIYDPLLT